MPFWRELDWKVLGALNQGPAPAWPEPFVLVDIPYRGASVDPSAFRGELASLLGALAEADSRPRLVVLDLFVSADPRAIAGVEEALARLRAAGVPVYAAINPLDRTGSPDHLFLDRHAKIYATQLDGFGHTLFELSGSTLRYDPYLNVSPAISIPALVVKIAEDHYGRPPTASTDPRVVNLGARGAAVAHTHLFTGPASLPRMAGRTVIVGSLAEDRSPHEGRSGPELVAWALIERAAGADGTAGMKILASPGLLVGVLLALSILAAATFVVVDRATRLRRWPLAAAAVASGTALATLALLVAAAWALGFVYPQVTLVGAGIVLATGLAWKHTRDRRLLESLHTDVDAGRPQGEAQYDVFISYSRTPENAAWVVTNIYEPLRAATKADGTPLRIFFDTRSLKAGASWYRSLVVAIEASRHFLPVYSADYFAKDFCRFEMERAAIVRVNRGDFIIPVMRDAGAIPTEYAHIQYVDSTRPDFPGAVLEHLGAARPSS